MFPRLSIVEFVSLYIELPLMLLMLLSFAYTHRGSEKIDIQTLDLYQDEHQDELEDELDEEVRQCRLHGKRSWLWRMYYFLA